MEERRPVGPRHIGHLPDVRAVGVGDEEVEIARLDEAVGQQRFVGLGVFAGGAAGTPDDLLRVGRKESTAVVAEFVGQLKQIAGLDFIAPQFEVAGAGGGEEDVAAIGRDGGFGVVALAADEFLEIAAVGVGGVDVVAVGDGPEVAALRGLRRGRAFAVGGVGRAEEEAVAGRKVATRGAPRAGRDEAVLLAVVERCAVGVHDVDLVAALVVDLRPIALEDQLFIVEAPVGLGVVAAEGELADVAQMRLAGIAQRVGGGVVRVDGRGCVGGRFALGRLAP